MNLLDDIEQMLAEKGNPCISIVVPTHRYSKGRMQDPKIIENAILKIKQMLQHSAWGKVKTHILNAKLDAVSEKIDYLRLQEGLAIFISPAIFKVLVLPFHVKEKTILGKNFEIRDAFYYSQFLQPYYLLAMSKKRMRLFKGQGRDLEEVINNDFPKQYVEEYEYEHPSIGSSSSPSLKDFERDKSVLQETRLKSFIKQADNALDKYLKGDLDFFVAGVDEELVMFEHVTQHLNQIVGKIAGNYDHDAVHPLAETAWKKIKESIKRSHKELLLKLQEDIGRHLAVDGIRDVWKMAKEGNGLTLLLEKDYQTMAYTDPLDDSKIFLTPPVGKYEIITDAADDLIESVKEKGGNVVIVENGELQAFNRIALLLRYIG